VKTILVKTESKIKAWQEQRIEIKTSLREMVVTDFEEIKN
jgi:hypothetical protein